MSVLFTDEGGTPDGTWIMPGAWPPGPYKRAYRSGPRVRVGEHGEPVFAPDLPRARFGPLPALSSLPLGGEP